MIKHLPILLTLTLVTAGANAGTERASYENPASKEEATGFFSGAILGALAGGPPGALVGAALGAFTGDGIRARNEVAEVRADLYAAQLNTERLREQARLREQEYQLAMVELDRLRDSRTVPAYLPDNGSATDFDRTALTVHFRTGSSSIEAQYEEQLASMVKLAQQLPTAVIEITGYADRNGDAARNLQLSRQRSRAVESYFRARGIQTSAITTVSHGETKPAHSAQSLETDFFDRRVIISLRDSSQQMLSHTPEVD